MQGIISALKGGSKRLIPVDGGSLQYTILRADVIENQGLILLAVDPSGGNIGNVSIDLPLRMAVHYGAQQ